MSETSTGTDNALNREHLSTHLNGSAIDAQVLEERGAYTVTKRADLERRGFSNRQIKPPGVMYPIHGVDGEIKFYLFRADDPRIRKGRPAKYEFPSGQQMAIDVPPRCREKIGDPKVPIFFTEGVKKADSGASRGLCVVSLIGTWNWRGTNDDGGKTVLADLEYIALKDKKDHPRKAYLAFDSDVMQKREVYAALKRFKEVLERRGADVQVVYLPNGEGGKKVGLDDFFAMGKTVDDLLECARKDLKPPPYDPGRADHALVTEAVEDIPAPPNLKVPSGYTLGKGGILKTTMSRDLSEERTESVVPAPIIIAGRTTDVNDGREATDLLYIRGGEWKRHTTPRSTACNSREIVKLSDFGVPVTSGNASDLVEYLGDFDATNIAELPHGKTSAQMGWQGKKGDMGFLWGKRLLQRGQPMPDTEVDVDALSPEEWGDGVMFRGADVGDEQLAAGFSPSGTFERWRKTMERLEGYPRVKLTVAGSLATPLLEVVGGDNFVIDLPSPTSRGKTTTLRIDASVWGNPDERAPESALGTWDATRVWIERASAILNSIPLMLDDTKRARHPRIVAQTLYDVTSGRGRGRGSREGLGRSGRWSTVLITTGEQPATTFTTDGGTRARVLTLWGSPFEGVSNEVGKLVAEVDLEVKKNYGHAGPRFVQYLLNNRDQWPSYQRKHQEYKEEYAKKAEGNAVLVRIADYCATLKLAVELASRAGVLPWGIFDPVAPLWDALAGEASEADQAMIALDMLYSWAQSNEASFHDREREDGEGSPIPPHGGYAGKWDRSEKWTQIAFYPHKLRELLERFDHDPDSTLRIWRDRGFIDCQTKDNRRLVKQIRVDGERKYLICIKRDALEFPVGKEEEGEEEEEIHF